MPSWDLPIYLTLTIRIFQLHIWVDYTPDKQRLRARTGGLLKLPLDALLEPWKAKYVSSVGLGLQFLMSYSGPR